MCAEFCGRNDRFEVVPMMDDGPSEWDIALDEEASQMVDSKEPPPF